MPVYSELKNKKKPFEKKDNKPSAGLVRADELAPAGSENSVENYLTTVSPPSSVGPPEEAMQRITDKMDVLKEYDRKNYNTRTQSTGLTLGEAWLHMKDVRVEKYSGPVLTKTWENNVLKVPPDVFPLVCEAQREIVRLEDIFRSHWTSILEKEATPFLSGQVDSVINAQGNALAEAMLALSLYANPNTADDADLFWHEEAEVLKVLANDMSDLLGEDVIISLLKENGGTLPSFSDNAENSETQRRDTLTFQLAKRLKMVAEKDPVLMKGIRSLTEKSVRTHKKSRRSLLIKASVTLRHAIKKSVRFINHVSENGDSRIFYNGLGLLKVLNESQVTLRSALRRLDQFTPGALENLKKTGALAIEAFDDGIFNTYVGKKLKSLKSAAIAGKDYISDLTKTTSPGFDQKLEKHYRVAEHLTQENKTALSVVLIPLDYAAEQVNSLVKPLQASAEQLKRVQRHELIELDTVLLTGPAVQDNPPLPTKGGQIGMVLGALLQTALGKEKHRLRLEDKVKKAEEEFHQQVEVSGKFLARIQQQLEGSFPVQLKEMQQRYSGYSDASAFLRKTEQLAQKFTAELSALTGVALKATRASMQDLPQTVSETASLAQQMARRCEKLMTDVRSASATTLGIKFRYKQRQKIILQELIGLVIELGKGSPYEEKKIVDYIHSLLRDGGVTALHQKDDPQNAVLRAGLDQEYASYRNQTQLRIPTVKELLDQTETIERAILRKATQKTVSGVVSLGMAGLADADIIADIANSVVNVFDPARRLLRPTTAMLPLQVRDMHKGLKGIKRATRPGQLRQDYASNKMINRKAAGLALSATSFIPSLLTLPLAAPVAIYGAATRPDNFLKDAASTLPLSVGFSGAFEGYRLASRTVSHLRQNAENREAYDLIKKLNHGQAVDDINLKDPQTRSAFLTFIKEHQDVLDEHLPEAIEEEMEGVNGTGADRLSSHTISRPNAENMQAYNLTKELNHGQTAENINDQQTPSVQHSSSQIKNEDHVQDAEKPMGRAKRSAPEQDIHPAQKFIKSNEENNYILDPEKWMKKRAEPIIEKYNKMHGNTKLSWDTKVGIRHRPLKGSQGEGKAMTYPIELLSGNGTPATLVTGETTLGGYTMGEHGRQDLGALNVEDMQFTINGRPHSIFSSLKKLNLQEEYIKALDEYLQRPEIQKLFNEYIQWRLNQIVNETSALDAEGPMRKQILKSIERNKVHTVRIQNHDIAGMICIRGGGGKLFIVALGSGRTFKVLEEYGGKRLKFENEQAAAAFVDEVKAGMTMYDAGRTGIKNYGQYIQPQIPLTSIRTEEAWLSTHATDDYASTIRDVHWKKSNSDADYLVKTPGEMKKDSYIKLAVKIGTFVSIVTLPAAGAITGVGFASKAAAIAGHAAFSAGTTVVTTTIPKLYQGATADRPDEARNAFIDAGVSLGSEAAGWGAGKAAGKAVSKGTEAAIKRGAKIGKAGKFTTEYTSQSATSWATGLGSDKVADAIKDAASENSDQPMEKGAPTPEIVEKPATQFHAHIDLQRVDAQGKTGTLSPATIRYMNNNNIRVDGMKITNYILKYGDGREAIQKSRNDSSFRLSSAEFILTEDHLVKIQNSLRNS